MIDSRSISDISATHEAVASWARSMWVVCAAFVLSRALIFGVWVLVACINVHEPTQKEGFLNAEISLSIESIKEELSELALYNDAGWYEGIARDGYESRQFDGSQQANWAFFPLFPYAWRLAMGFTGEPIASGLVLANTLFFFALLSLHRLISALGEEQQVADLAVALLAFFPTSYFFSLPWSESLFLLSSTLAFLFALRRKWALLFAAGACACACRFVGVAIVPSLLLMLWPHRRSIPAYGWLAVASIPAGLLVFMYCLWAKTGNALAFMDVQQAWGRSLLIPYKALGVVIAKPWAIASDWNLRLLNFGTAVGGLLLAIFLYRRRYIGFAFFLAFGLIAPLMTGTITSMARYGMALFPLAFALAMLIQHRDANRLLLAFFSALLVLMALAFQMRFSFAGA